MLKELSVEELEELFTLNTELNEVAKDIAKEIRNGGKVKVKEKTTKQYHSFVVYRYDDKLYRYGVVGEYYI